MTEQPSGPTVSSERGLVRRLGGVIFAPRATFAEIAAVLLGVYAVIAVGMAPLTSQLGGLLR